MRSMTKQHMWLHSEMLYILIIFLMTCFLVQVHAEGSMIRSSSLKEVVTQEEKMILFEYFDETGKLTYAADKRYATMVKTIEDQTILVEFFDEEGKPSKQEAGYYAIRYHLNEKGQNVQSDYLGTDYQPVLVSTTVPAPSQSVPSTVRPRT